MIAVEFGIPLANFALPKAINLVFQSRNLKLPISVPLLRYYDEFILNYKFSERPEYVPNNL